MEDRGFEPLSTALALQISKIAVRVLYIKTNSKLSSNKHFKTRCIFIVCCSTDWATSLFGREDKIRTYNKRIFGNFAVSTYFWTFLTFRKVVFYIGHEPIIKHISRRILFHVPLPIGLPLDGLGGRNWTYTFGFL